MYVNDTTVDNPVVLQTIKNNKVITTEVYDIDSRHVSNTVGKKTEMYILSRNGSVIEKYNSKQEQSFSASYNLYGTIKTATGSSLSNFTYNGERLDSSGLIYLRARYYDTSLGQFISKDTYKGELNSTLSQNQYIYTMNNPLKYTDPSGHLSIKGIKKGFKIVKKAVKKAFVESVNSYYNVGSSMVTGTVKAFVAIPVGAANVAMYGVAHLPIVNKTNWTDQVKTQGNKKISAASNVLTYFVSRHPIIRHSKWAKEKEEQADKVLKQAIKDYLNLPKKQQEQFIGNLGGAYICSVLLAQGLKALKNPGKAANAVDNMTDAGKAVDKVSDASKVIDDILPNSGNGTGTVWDDIKITQENVTGTNIPKSFEIKVNGQKYWVHPNATKHMTEYSTNIITSHQGLTEQEILKSFQSAISKATTKGYTYEVPIQIDNWELIFSPARDTGGYTVINHALYK